MLEKAYEIHVRVTLAPLPRRLFVTQFRAHRARTRGG
jgi:hypothetical protein